MIFNGGIFHSRTAIQIFKCIQKSVLHLLNDWHEIRLRSIRWEIQRLYGKRPSKKIGGRFLRKMIQQLIQFAIWFKTWKLQKLECLVKLSSMATINLYIKWIKFEKWIIITIASRGLLELWSPSTSRYSDSPPYLSAKSYLNNLKFIKQNVN